MLEGKLMTDSGSNFHTRTV